MYGNLTDSLAREHRCDLRTQAAAARAGRRGAGRRAHAGNGKSHSAATVARSLHRPFAAFGAWYSAGEL